MGRLFLARDIEMARTALRGGNRASWDLKNRAILRGSGENRRRNRRGSRDFGALSVEQLNCPIRDCP